YAAAARLFLRLVPAAGGGGSAPAVARGITPAAGRGWSVPAVPAATPGWPAPTVTGCAPARTIPDSRTALRSGRRSPVRGIRCGPLSPLLRRQSVAGPVAVGRPGPNPPRTD